MKNFRKLAFLLILALAFCVVSCNKAQAAPQPTSNVTQAPAQSTQAPAAASSAVAPAQTVASAQAANKAPVVSTQAAATTPKETAAPSKASTSRNGNGDLTVRIDTPESAKIKNVHISVRDIDAPKDEKPVKEFDLEKQFNWRRFDKFTGTTEGVPSGDYFVVADFTDVNNAYLFSKELGNTAVVNGKEAVNAHEKIIPGPVFKVANNDNGTKKVDFEKDVYDSAIYYTDKAESVLPDNKLHIEGLRFNGPFDVDESKEYRAVAVADDMIVSPVTKSGKINILKAQPPVANIAPGTYLEAQNVKLSTVTPGCTIFYTTDGTEPGRNSIQYTDAGVPVEKITEIKAMAASLDGTYIDSDSATFNYLIKALPPVSDHADGTYDNAFDAVLSNQTEGCTIYYTVDGTNPTQDSPKFNRNIPVTKNTTIKAIAADNGYVPSDVATFKYNVKAPVTISADPMPAIFAEPVDVTLRANGVENADIYYTVNGADPTLASTKYTGPVHLDAEATIKAMATAPDYVPSDPATFTLYQFKVATPTANVERDEIYASDHKLALETATEGASIIYSVDGGSDTRYTAPLSLPSGKHTVTAYGVKRGWIDSDPATFEYEVINALDPPVIETPSGNYKSIVSTKIQRVGMAEVLNADIYYTTDNSVSDAEIATKGTKYNLGDTLTFERSTVLRAVAVKAPYATSSVASARYNILVKDVAFSSVPIEDQPNMFKIEIECETPGAIIYYTTDGSLPTTRSTVYNGTFDVARGVEVQAFAEKEGCISSGVVSYTRKN
jgi:hypothetical protein